MRIRATITVYRGHDGSRLASADHAFADVAAIADVVMMHYAQRNECIVDFANGEYITTTLNRMDHVGAGAARREVIAAILSRHPTL